MKRLFFYATLFAAATWLAFAELNPPGNDGVASRAITNNQQSAWSSTGNVTLNGTANLAPNQTAASGSSLLTRDLADDRYRKVFSLRPSDIAAFGATAAMQRDFPGGGQMVAARFSAANDAASFWLTPPPAGKTQLVVRAWVLTTNSGVLASALQVGDLPVSGGRTISVSNIFDHGTSAVGTNLNIITNTVNVTVSGQVQGLSWVWLTNTTGAIWFTYGEGWWQ
jgi:hypothetical protein